jgi:hypothetical protein
LELAYRKAGWALLLLLPRNPNRLADTMCGTFGQWNGRECAGELMVDAGGTKMLDMAFFSPRFLFFFFCPLFHVFSTRTIPFSPGNLAFWGGAKVTGRLGSNLARQ